MNIEGNGLDTFIPREIMSEILITSDDGKSGTIIPLFRSESGNCGTQFEPTGPRRVSWTYPAGGVSQSGNPIVRIVESLSVSGRLADVRIEGVLCNAQLVSPSSLGVSRVPCERFGIVALNVTSILQLPRFALSILSLGLTSSKKQSFKPSLVGDVLRAAASMEFIDGYVIGVKSNEFQGAMTILSKLPDGTYAIRLSGHFDDEQDLPIDLKSEWIEEVNGIEMHASSTICEVLYLTTRLQELTQFVSGNSITS